MQTPPDLAQAIARHERYAEFDPGNTALQLALGDLYRQAGRLDAAQACYRRCLEADPAGSAARSRLAAVELALHRFTEAEALLRPLLESGDRSPALLHNLGLALHQQQRYEEAAGLFAEAAEAGIALPANEAWLARALHHLGRMQEACQAARRWLDLDGSREARSYLALLYADDGDTESGLGLAREVLAEDPDDVDANVVAGIWSMEQQRSDAARTHYASALRREDGNGRAWLGMGLVHLYEQEYRQAVEALGKAAAIHPDNAGIVATLGWATLVAGDPAGARAVFERAIEVEPNLAESHGGRAAALVWLGDLDGAQHGIRVAKRLDAASMGADIAKTMLLSAQGRQDDAADTFARMLERRPAVHMEPMAEQLRLYFSKQAAAGRPSPAARRPPTR